MPGPDPRKRAHSPKRPSRQQHGFTAVAAGRAPKRPPQPLAKTPMDEITAAGQLPGGTPAQGNATGNATGNVPERRLDGEGKPFLTLAQFAKAAQLAESGGAAKVLVREGEFTVNGQPEPRPGRKLHNGDIVIYAGETFTIEVADG